ncbi:restriction endonuclease subunit S [Acinetobacter pseudolwoffii]|uniref:restriction endonuclease subunit S n=1 Tax=Acinetobacter pseudolwoffii TaxID=2053287 RepID=UPI00209AAC76|nr:restriction endonuclease subunit S [Acinetobacter pseudolwoffii]MCO8090076.1 restriction endonuclease subunit S [Acinetobacter pseudolwoffii]
MNQDNLKDLLLFLNFKQHQNVFTKKFISGDHSLSIDFEKKEIIYPKAFGLKVNERQTCNFSSNENFVVFECVHRLLEKGYKPEHIELEPKWKLGHGASGGRADILVKNHQNQPFLIIECKTFDREFNKAWKDTLEDGGQLFSYVEQEKSVEFVCLYASQWNETDKKIDDQQRIISVKDNPIILKDLPDALNYSNANNVKERFKVWKDTYQLEATEKGIFEDNIQAYQIGKDKYTLAIDTQPINSMDIKGKYHDFRTILRKHNVSRRENAFEVLVNLFLCKIVDEIQNPEDLHFYWKGIAYDSYFDLVDRLQKLYKIGMQQFLQQDIVYVSQDDIDGAFWAIKQKPNATEQRIKELFQQLKFYKGLDFEFIKVSNKEKFEKNAKILIEIIQMWQGLRLTSTEENQFLGDMFEYFLDNGIKQSEGQFFTPIPICKFIVSALPLESMLQKKSEPLKVIDYACGSGHFLNEYGSQVSKLLKLIKDIDEPNSYYAQTYGIEKEDRLAKVSKVASFMYGRNEVKIIDADALISHEEIKLASFDILVANPPFAVEDFLQTIDEVERDKFQLFDLVNPSTNNIQCFFLERAQQLLAPDSVMGVIVPSSILTNSNEAVYIGTREILLQYFDFLSIVELGNQTFGKTGTNTVVLFLRRKAQRPEQAVQFRNRVNNFFADWENEKASNGGAYQDIKVVEKYCQHTQIDFALYETLLKGELNADLLAIEIFKDYQANFNKQAEIVNLKKQRQFKAKTETEQQAELDKRLLNYLVSIERDKLYYFMLTQYNAMVDNKARALMVVKSPSDNKEQKKFLGYEWSSAKGNEGLSYLGGDTVFDINTPLFDPKDRENSEKISYVIRQNFNGEQVSIPEHLTPFVSQVYLHDVLDFSRKEFNKAFNLSAQSKVEIVSRYEQFRLSDLCKEIYAGGDKPKKFSGEKTENLSIPVVSNGITNDGILGFTDISRTIEPCITVSGRGTIGFTVARNYEFYPIVRLLVLIPNNNLNYKFLALMVEKLDLKGNGAGVQQLTVPHISDYKIPLPPLDVQQKIVQECEAVDQQMEQAQSTIANLHMQVAQVIDQAQGTMTKLIDVTTKIGSGATPKGGESAYKDSGITLIRSQNVYDGAFLEKGLAFIDDEQAKKLENVTVESQDVLFNITGASVARCCVVQDKYLPARVNQHVAIIRANSEVLLPKFLQAVLVSKEYKAQLLQMAQGAVSREAITKAELEEFKIPVPALTEQEKIVQKIEALEAQITQAQKVIDNAPQQKQAILQKYL